jgi:hypothetical protein
MPAPVRHTRAERVAVPLLWLVALVVAAAWVGLLVTAASRLL